MVLNQAQRWTPLTRTGAPSGDNFKCRLGREEKSTGFKVSKWKVSKPLQSKVDTSPCSRPTSEWCMFWNQVPLILWVFVEVFCDYDNTQGHIFSSGAPFLTQGHACSWVGKVPLRQNRASEIKFEEPLSSIGAPELKTVLLSLGGAPEYCHNHKKPPQIENTPEVCTAGSRVMEIN